jgi:hypothetical protein
VFDDPKFKRHTVVDKRGRATGAKCVATAATAASLQALTPRCRRRERTDDMRRFYRLPEEDAAGAEARAVALQAALLVRSAAAPLACRRTPLETTTTTTTTRAAVTSAKSKAQLRLWSATAPAAASVARFLCHQAPATKVTLEPARALACAACLC